ncbi:MAG: PilZ domain-containing protein [Vallitaleaceae bacterium]|nr:PilZ domain-containing protein [Vallitaleaceae bacterium]
MEENKRTRQRIDYKNHILCYKHIISNKEEIPDPAPIRVIVEDISYSGLGVRCTRDLGAGDVLIFNLENAGDKREVMLEVMWCRYSGGEYEAGLKFINLTKEIILFLDGLIKNHLKQKKKLMDKGI